MCEGVDTCPKTGENIINAACKIVPDFLIGADCLKVVDSTKGELPTILQLPAGEGNLARAFFRTGWTQQR